MPLAAAVGSETQFAGAFAQARALVALVPLAWHIIFDTKAAAGGHAGAVNLFDNRLFSVYFPFCRPRRTCDHPCQEEWKMLRVGGLVALCLMLLALPAQAQKSDLVLLGEKSVGFLADRDVIEIGKSEDWFRDRAFTQLHFAAERNDLHLLALKIVYLNGHAEEIRVDKTIRAGRQLAVDLRGSRSYLRRVEMVYRSRPSFRGQAIIKVYGETARRPGGPGKPVGFEPHDDWLLLGEQKVGFGVDKDTINVRHSEDWFRNRAFRMLHFVTEDNDLHLLSLRIVYFNGFTETIRVDKQIRAGGHVAVDLRGDKSFLRRIEMTYRSKPSFRGQATVKVYGELAGRGRR